MRIIAGKYRGRRLKTQRGREVRPTSDKLRETLFNILQTEVPGSTFIDCYAGSGAVGIEALSRGAAEVWLIEESTAAARIIADNLASLKLSAGDGRATLVRAEARAGLRRLAARNVRAQVCFLDPPYATLEQASKTLSWLCNSALMDADGWVILEHGGKDKPPEQAGKWRHQRLLLQGSSAFSFYRKE
jgi:16S rRNA (guanine(966)-N(2))-methyltransferase RsmD